MTSLIAVDWGTSSLRAARIAADGAVLEERSSARGILTVPAGGFPGLLRETCGDWLADPRAMVPGALMPQSVKDATERANIIAYLKSISPARAAEAAKPPKG